MSNNISLQLGVTRIGDLLLENRFTQMGEGEAPEGIQLKYPSTNDLISGQQRTPFNCWMTSSRQRTPTKRFIVLGH